MSQFFDYTGVVEEVLPVQTFSSGFTKRDVIVGNDVDSPSKYPNPVKFTFKKDNCSLLDGIQKGQRVQVHFVVDGRRWDGPKGTQYFVDLTALKIEVLNADGTSTEPVPAPAEPDTGGRTGNCRNKKKYLLPDEIRSRSRKFRQRFRDPVFSRS